MKKKMVCLVLCICGVLTMASPGLSQAYDELLLDLAGISKIDWSKSLSGTDAYLAKFGYIAEEGEPWEMVDNVIWRLYGKEGAELPYATVTFHSKEPWEITMNPAEGIDYDTALSAAQTLFGKPGATAAKGAAWDTGTGAVLRLTGLDPFTQEDSVEFAWVYLGKKEAAKNLDGIFEHETTGDILMGMMWAIAGTEP